VISTPDTDEGEKTDTETSTDTDTITDTETTASTDTEEKTTTDPPTDEETLELPAADTGQAIAPVMIISRILHPPDQIHFLRPALL
jgi:hypothetical protein